MWDVIVIGGGAAGARCATALASAPWEVLVVDAPRAAKPALAEALAPGTARALRRGLAPGAFDVLATPVRGLHASWQGQVSMTDYELERCSPGCAIFRPEIDEVLLQQAAIDGAVVRRGWRCTQVSAAEFDVPAAATFSTPDGRRRADARLIVVATGRTPVPGTPARTYLDRQTAFASRIDGDQTHGLLWVEQDHHGWWYVMPAVHGTTQVVFVSEMRAASGERVQRFSDAFARTRSSGSACPSAPRFARVDVYDARASMPASPGGARMLLVGDSSGTVDPLSGQGWARALASADEAAERADTFLRRDAPVSALAHHSDNVRWLNDHLADRASLQRGLRQQP